MHLAGLVVVVAPLQAPLPTVQMVPTKMVEMRLLVVGMGVMEVMEISPAEQVGQLPVEAEVELKGVSFAVPPMVGMVPMVESLLPTYHLRMWLAHA